MQNLQAIGRHPGTWFGMKARQHPEPRILSAGRAGCGFRGSQASIPRFLMGSFFKICLGFRFFSESVLFGEPVGECLLPALS